LGLFNASVSIKLGPGSNVLFWEDAWIGGLAIDSIAPAVLELVKPAVRRTRTVQQGKLNNSWAQDISGQLSVDAVVQYLRLWEAASHELQQVDDIAVSDVFRWRWTADGSYSSKGAYRALFHGTVGLPAAPLVWNSFAPLKFKFHAWLALRRRCWTADRRLRRGLPSHTLCKLCDASDETLDHLSLHCPYARAIWAGLVVQLRLPDFTPTGDLGINDWWLQAAARFAKADRRSANSLIMLTLRSLWLERNARVFEDKRLPHAVTLGFIVDEWLGWVRARHSGRLPGE
jgi:hypothetical protein